MTDFEYVQMIKRCHAFSLLCKTAVVGVGIGDKYVQDGPTGTMSITILVEEKIIDSLLPAKDRLPRELDGIPTDVVPIHGNKTAIQAGPRKLPMPGDKRTGRWRPAPGGVSVGHYLLEGAGTLGAWISDPMSGEPMLLSCWHVIANMGNCKKGDPILQPATLDGGRLPEDIIAYLDRWIDVEMIVPTTSLNDARRRLKELLASDSPLPTNEVDAALARPISDSVVSYEILGIGKLNFAATSEKETTLNIGAEVVKSGRTTGVTRGTINLTDVDIFVEYPIGIALFTSQLMALS